jgi:hypothetical protein
LSTLLLPNNTTPSLRQGFYSPKTGGTPRYPELWRGVWGAWNPALGVLDSGVLHDLTGNSRDFYKHADPADWQTVNGLIAFSNPSGTVNRVYETAPTPGRSYLAFNDPPVTFCTWVRFTGSNGWLFTDNCDRNNAIPGFGVAVRSYGGNIEIQIYSGSSGLSQPGSGASLADRAWHHIAVVCDGSTLEFWHDGVKTATRSFAFARSGGSSYDDMSYAGGCATLENISNTFRLIGAMTDTMYFNRLLTDNEIRLLASRPSVAYERKRTFFSFPTQVEPTSTASPATLIVPDKTTPSIKQGFYSPRTGGVPAHPELWRGLKIAYSPNIGVTGSRLINHASSENNGEFAGGLSAASAWQVSGGDHSLRWDGTYGHRWRVVQSDSTDTLVPHDNFTIACWVKADSINKFPYWIIRGNYINYGTGLTYGVATNNNQIRFFCSGATEINAAYTPDGQWMHIAGVSSPAGVFLYRDGELVDSDTASTGFAADSGNPYEIYGGALRPTLSGNDNINGNGDDFLIYDRALSPNDIRLLASRRGVLYERKRRLLFSSETTTPEAEPAESVPRSFGLIPNRTQPSIRQGFYSPRTGGVPQHPELWRDVVLWYGFNLGETGRLIDCSHRNWDGSFTAPNWGVNAGVRSLTFNGSSSRAVADTKFALTYESGATFSAWIYPHTVAGGTGFNAANPRYILATVDNAGTLGDTANATVFFRLLGGHLDLVYRSANGLDWLTNRSDSEVVVVNQWQHVAIVHDRDEVRHYVNGVQVPSTSSSTGGSAIPDDGTGVPKELYVGAEYNRRYFDGYIAEIAVHKRPLSDNEIRLLSTRPGIAYERKQPLFFSTEDFAETETAESAPRFTLLPNRTTPSIKSGFYSPKTGGIPAHPELWRGCVAAWAPCLDSQNSRFVKDFSSNNANSGTFLPSVVFDLDERSQRIGGVGCIYFNSGSVYIDFGDMPEMDFVNERYSVVCWFRRQDTSSAQQAMISKGGYSSGGWSFTSTYNGSSGYGINLTQKGAGGTLAGASNSYEDPNVPLYQADEWVCGIAMGTTDTSSSSGNSVRLVVNGIEATGLPQNQNGVYTADSVSVEWGRRGATSVSHYNGWIAEIRVYNRHLSQSEINLLSNRPGIAYERKRPLFFSTEVVEEEEETTTAPAGQFLLIPNRTTPSIRQGFYSPRTGGIAQYPQLWRGCVGAYSPHVQGYGSFLADWSLNKGQGTLNDLELDDWERNQGILSIGFDGNPENVSIPVPSGFGGIGTTWSIVGWVFGHNGASDTIVGLGSSTASNPFIVLDTERASARDDARNEQLSVNYQANPVNSKWNMYAATFDGQTLRYYVNGGLRGSDTATTFSTLTVNHANIGCLDRRGTLESFIDLPVGTVLLYDRAISFGEIVSQYRMGQTELFSSKRRLFFSTGTEETTATFGLLPVRSNVTPSIRQGFYSPRTGGSPQHPELWEGIHQAWPILPGEGGSKLRSAVSPDWDMTISGGDARVYNGVPSLYLDGTDDYAECPTPAIRAGQLTDGMTISFWHYTREQLSYQIWLDCSDAGEDSASITIYGSGTTSHGEIIFFNRDVLVAETPTYIYSPTRVGFSGPGGWGSYTVGRWTHTCITVKNQGKLSLFRDGELAGIPKTMTTGSMPIFEAGSTWKIGTTASGDFGDGATRYGDFSIADVRVYDRPLSPKEVFKLASRPWIAYERKQLMPFGELQTTVAAEVPEEEPPTGPSIYVVSISETVTVTDEFTSVMTMPVTIGESLVLADSFTQGATVIAVSITESLVLNDGYAATLTMPGSISESLDLSDAYTSSMTLTASISESMLFTDVTGAGSVMPVAVGESLLVGDSLSNTMTMNAAIAETLDLADFFSLGNFIVVAIDESISLDDTASHLLTMAAAVSESITLSDLTDRTLTMQVGVAETLQVSDAYLNQVAMTVGVAEQLDLVDETTNTRVFAVGIEEAIGLGYTIFTVADIYLTTRLTLIGTSLFRVEITGTSEERPDLIGSSE